MNDKGILEIVFTRSRKRFPFFSYIVRWYTSVRIEGIKGIFKLFPYSHCARGISYGHGERIYFHASEGEVKYEFEKYFLQKHEIIKVYRIEVSRDIEALVKKESHKQTGREYAYRQNLGIVWTNLIYNLLGKKKPNPWKKGMNCSELLYRFGFKMMISGLKYDANKIMPHHLEEIILEYFDVDENERIWKRKRVGL